MTSASEADPDTPLIPADPGTFLESLRARLFFVVGCGRSGTTLLQSALLAHPDLAMPPETKYFDVYPPRAARYGDPTRSEHDFLHTANRIREDQHGRGIETEPAVFTAFLDHVAHDFDGIFLALLAAHAVHIGRTRVGEKSPVHTHWVGHLKDAFPDAKFIHVLRDPRAVVSSRVKAGFGTDLLAPNVDRWKRAAEMDRTFGPVLGPDRYRVVRYEELVTDLEPVIRGVCEFLDLEFRDEMLKPHEREQKGFPGRSKDWMENTLKPVFTSSIDKWKETMSSRDIALVEHGLRGWMEPLGYEPTGAKTAAAGLQLGWQRGLRVAEHRFRMAQRAAGKVFGR